jgi:hypothetical protein
VAPAQLDAGAPASSNQPIGSGPFIQKEWIPGQPLDGHEESELLAFR